jgi:hypothetical protein
VILYFSTIAAVILFLIARSFCTGENTFDDMAEVIKIALIPIVTLVVGYYFSSKS